MNTKTIYQASVLKYINAKDHFEELRTYRKTEMASFLSSRIGKDKAEELLAKGSSIYEDSIYKIALTIF